MTGLESFGAFEAASLRPDVQGITNAISDLHGSFESSVSVVADAFDSVNSHTNEGIAQFIGIDDEVLLQSLRPSVMELTQRMLDGITNGDGIQTLSLNEISTWNRNPDFYYQNTRQQAGYVAEVISTAKENLRAIADGTGLTTFRADDRPDLGFLKNDPYVDKIRVNQFGEIVERIQTKFVGDDGADWVKKMMQQKFEKYLDDAKVDKLECPSNYFDDAKAYISQRKAELTEQLERVTADGKGDVAEAVRHKIDKLNRIDEMIEKSTVTMDEAVYARNHPKRYAAKIFATETFKESAKEGVNSAIFTAGLTFVTSSVMHGTEFIDGEISAEEMVREIATETGAATILGGATGFVTVAVANTMQASSCTLIKSIGGSCLPASAVSFAVESYDSVMDYAQGAIDESELAYDLGHNAATIAGGAAAGMKTGAVAGSMFGPAGTAAGTLIGGLVGSAVASGAYETALEYAPEAAQEIADQAESYAKQAMEVIENEYPDQIDSARASFNDFFASYNMPVRI